MRDHLYEDTTMQNSWLHTNQKGAGRTIYGTPSHCDYFACNFVTEYCTLSFFCLWWALLCYCRSYYRCTYRQTQGCMATKQVQKSDEDPSILKITYKGRHTCNQASQLSPHLALVPKNGPQQKKYQLYQEEETRICHKRQSLNLVQALKSKLMNWD